MNVILITIQLKIGISLMNSGYQYTICKNS